MVNLGNRAQLDLGEICARNPVLPLIGQRVKLERSGRHYKGCCPFHGEKTPSFYVYDDHYHCFGCGEHGDVIDFVMRMERVTFHGAVELLTGAAGLSTNPQRQPSARPANRPASDTTALVAAAIWGETAPGAGSPVEAYLAARGCGGAELPVALRYHPACPRGAGERVPAMVALMTDPTSNQPTGIHRTFLRPDGRGKIEHGPTKMMLGHAGLIRLTPDENVTLGLGICEGIETGLAIMRRAGWGAIWAAGSAGGIAKFPALAGIECLTIFPDRDASGAGQIAAAECAARWGDAGREVRIVWPPGIGCDWLDALASEAAA